VKVTKEDRVTTIKTRARALWKKFKGNALRSGNEEDDIILKEYVTGCRDIPNEEIIRTFEAASKADKLPRGHELDKFRPGHSVDQGLSPLKKDPFSFEFREWLSWVGLKADNLHAKTKDKHYRLLALMADQTDMTHGLVGYCKGKTTNQCIELFKEWVREARIPLSKLGEVTPTPKEWRAMYTMQGAVVEGCEVALRDFDRTHGYSDQNEPESP